MKTQKIENIPSAALMRMVETGWMVHASIGAMILGMILSVVFQSPNPLFIAAALIFGSFAYVVSQVRVEFWKQFATSRGWTYTSTSSLEHEEGLIFGMGHSQKIGNTVSGEESGLSKRIFEFSFQTGSGKHKETHHYTGFGFRFPGSFPHVFLNRKDSGYDVNTKKNRLPIPQEFEKYFTLHGPEQYEIEVLAIFTLETFEFLLQEQWPYDIELVDSELLVFRHKQFDDLHTLESEWGRAEKLVEHLAPRLHHASVTPIGDYSHLLRN